MTDMRCFLCLACGKRFTSRKVCKSRLPKFCSRKCAAVRWAKPKTCKTCKRTFINWQNSQFCSNACKFKARRGVRLTPEHRCKLSAAKLGKQPGPKHGCWKGNRVGYTALHDWVRSRLGKAKHCRKCGTTVCVHWANKSGKYLRRKDDWLELCATHHKEYDLKNKHDAARLFQVRRTKHGMAYGKRKH